MAAHAKPALSSPLTATYLLDVKVQNALEIARHFSEQGVKAPVLTKVGQHECPERKGGKHCPPGNGQLLKARALQSKNPRNGFSIIQTTFRHADI